MLHGSAALSSVFLLLVAATSSCSAESAESGAPTSSTGAQANAGGPPDGDAGDSGGGVTSAGGSGGTGNVSSGGISTGGSNSGGSAGTTAMGGAAGAEPEACPDQHGSPMVRLPPEAGGFCIDAHETTRGEYAEFLEAAEDVEQIEECAWNLSFEPTEGQNDTDMNLPVVGVDFCDAHAYCTWAGKRMCGAIGGGSTDFEAFADPTVSQWQAACSRGGTRAFPYGNTYDGSLCNGADYSADQDATIAVGESQCVGGYEGIFDMSGNVWEWEDSCFTDMTDDLVKCRLRGGEFSNPEGFLRCDYGGFYITRDFTTNSIGIRCCEK